jgi:hypothetical protein
LLYEVRKEVEEAPRMSFENALDEVLHRRCVTETEFMDMLPAAEEVGAYLGIMA